MAVLLDRMQVNPPEITAIKVVQLHAFKMLLLHGKLVKATNVQTIFRRIIKRRRLILTVRMAGHVEQPQRLSRADFRQIELIRVNEGDDFQ